MIFFQLGFVFEFELDLAGPGQPELCALVEVVEHADVGARAPVGVLVAQLTILGVAQTEHVIVDRHFGAEVAKHEAWAEADGQVVGDLVGIGGLE